MLYCHRPAQDLMIHLSKINMHFFHIFTWNFQIAFLTAYLVFTIRLKWAFAKLWKQLVRKANLLTFCSNGRIQICDSLTTSLSRVNKKCAHALYKNCVKEFIISFSSVQKQIDGYNCGPFLAEILDGKSPVEVHFDVERMRGHLIDCLENTFLIPFPKVWSHLSV